VTDGGLIRDPDFGIKAAAILSVGPAVAIVVRAPDATTEERLAATDRVRALARPAEAATFAHGDPAVARAAEAQGVQLRRQDLDPALARRVFPDGWIGVSVHDEAEAELAIAGGADYLVAGSVYPSATHPGSAPLGLERLGRIAALGRPVVAIGGITPERIRPALEAGAFGVAAIRSLWHDPDPARAADRMARELAA
jgi:thiamine-phosphate pyrophosphorylase